MITETRNSECHVRIYNSDGLVLSTSPPMNANELAHILLDIIADEVKK